MPTVGKVRLKIPPWIAIMLNEQGSGWSTLEREIVEGATIGDLLVDLSFNYTNFRKMVFNPDTGKVNKLIGVILNDRLLQLSEITNTKLNNKDTVLLLPLYAGG